MNSSRDFEGFAETLAVVTTRRSIVKGLGGLGLAAAAGALALPGEGAAAGSHVQSGWDYCKKCRGLYFAVGGRGICPKGGKHAVGIADYSVDFL